MALVHFHPGETVVMNFVLPFNQLDVKAVVLSFRDRNSVVLETMATGFKSEGENNEKTRVGYTLTQEESLLFEENSIYQLQLNVFGPNGSRIVSNEIRVETYSQQIPFPGFTEINTFNYNYGPSEGSHGDIISYNDLIDKPRINERVLIGNRDLPENRISNNQIDELINS